MRVQHDSLSLKRSRHWMAGVAAVVVGLSVAAGAHAKPDMGIDPILPTLPIGPNPDESSTGLDLIVYGVIPSRCALGQGAEIDFGELSGGLRADATLALECNVPFELNVRSSNGGLAHVAQPGGEGGFAGRLAYDLGVELPLLDPAMRVVTRTFASQQLLTGATISSADAIAAGGATLHFSTKNPEGHGLLAGQYSETIVLTIAPRM